MASHWVRSGVVRVARLTFAVTRFYMGVRVGTLQRYFMSLSTAEKAFASAAFHLFQDLQPILDPKQSASFRILQATADRPPTYRSAYTLAELTRTLAGPELADYLGLPDACSTREKLRLKASLFASRALVEFGRIAPAWWEQERIGMTRTAVSMVVAWSLGSKRSTCIYYHSPL